ncbi:MAG: peptidoglycan-binding protein [Frankia sp.]|nr:peptidoglycan-binding protein [Frankia sp.]
MAVVVAVLFSAAPPAFAATSATVDVQEVTFSPSTVAVDVGGTVTWTFNGAGEHSITADSGAFDSNPSCSTASLTDCATAGAAAFTATFPAAGSYAYYCRIHGAPGGVGMAGVVVVSTPDTTPPAAVSALVASAADRQVTLHWTNPADADFTGVVVRRAEGSVAPASATDGEAVYSGPATTATATGLTNGTTYAFAVFARDAGANTSAPTSVTAVPRDPELTALRIARAPATVLYGTPVTIGARLLLTATGGGLPGQPVEVVTRRRGTTAWTPITRLVTSVTGDVTYRHVPHYNADYAVRHLYTPMYAASISPVAPVASRPRISARLSSLVVERGANVTLSGSVLPAHAGQGVYLQRYAAGAWHRVALTTLSSTGGYVFGIKASIVGTYQYRAYKPADTDHLSAVTSAVKLTVLDRTLSSGMSGVDVLALQRRLAELHYDPGAANGYFGYDTLHAVYAFQKQNALPRTGVVTPGVRARLSQPTAALLAHPVAGTSVEVDLTKQVLYFAQDGVVRRILDVSTGSGQLYTVDGITSRAITPEGAFRIERKIDGVRVSRLGELYRPAYFFQGYAIHGNGSVPVYPASHGCIRITNPAMNRLFALLTIGARVWVYRS